MSYSNNINILTPTDGSLFTTYGNKTAQGNNNREEQPKASHNEAETTVTSSTVTASSAKVTEIVARGGNQSSYIREDGQSIFAENDSQCDIIEFMNALIKKASQITQNIIKLCQKSMEYSKEAFETALKSAMKQFEAATNEFIGKMVGFGLSASVAGSLVGKMGWNAIKCAANYVKPTPLPMIPIDYTVVNVELSAVRVGSDLSTASGDMAGAGKKAEATELQSFVDFLKEILQNNERFFANHEELRKKIMDLVEKMNQALSEILYLKLR